MTVAADAPTIRLAPASNIALTFSLTVRWASRSASSSPVANIVRRRRITLQDSNASMALASQANPASNGSKQLRVLMVQFAVWRFSGHRFSLPSANPVFNENALQILMTRRRDHRHFGIHGDGRLTKAANGRGEA